MFDRLKADIKRDLDELRVGRMSRAVELSRRTGSHFNSATCPLYFTGDLRSPLVLVHLNPKQADNYAERCTERISATVDEYIDEYAHFGRRMYGPDSPHTHKSPFDNKQVRFLRPFGVIDFLDSDDRKSHLTNLERVIDHKLQMEVIPYGSDTFSPLGMTPAVLKPHLERLLDTITATDRDYVIFCGAVFRKLLAPFVIREHRFRLIQNDGTLAAGESRFANLSIEFDGKRFTAGLAYSFAKQGLPVAAYGRECARLYGTDRCMSS
jgi:hypothetical protein